MDRSRWSQFSIGVFLIPFCLMGLIAEVERPVHGQSERIGTVSADTAAISGRVTDASGVGIANIYIDVSDTASAFNNWISYTDVSGFYTISGLPTGIYKVWFNNNRQNYLSEWYKDKASFDMADKVVVTAGSITSAIDAQLAAGGQISGRVTDDSGRGIQSILVTCHSFGSYDWRGSAITDSAGCYTISSLPSGSYIVKFNNNGRNFISEWYNDKASFETADQVAVIAGGTTSEINAQLATGGQISGRVTDDAGVGISSGRVDVLVYDLNYEQRETRTTDSMGNYVVSGLPAGNYKVHFVPYHRELLIAEWYNDKSRYETADQIVVTAGSMTSDINAQLAAKVAIIGLSKTSFNFAAEQNGTPTRAETVSISNIGTGTLIWTAQSFWDWISVSPGSGTGSGILTISISRTDLPAGSYAGVILITDPNARNSPQTINIGLTILPVGTSSSPFGSFDTPANGSTVMSSIAVTGWALDDIETTGVKIYRDPVGAEPAGSRIYIGDATFVEGARPDVELAYPSYPLNDRAGWGYMLLTNSLPNGGNGTFTIHAYATDKEGHEVQLGSKTITCDNKNAVLPFGAIDTPAQGGDASGSAYFNFGWALTPLPNSIPTDGSTLGVWVDGALIGHPTYNNYRADIATLFPGYANSNGAVGVFTLDTTAYANGVHTIAWSVRDNAGNEDGIGSRYFSILNTGTPSPQSESPIAGMTGASSPRASGAKGSFATLGELSGFRDVSMNPIFTRTGYDRSQLPITVISTFEEGTLLNIRELERMEVLLDENAWAQDAERRSAERAGQPPASPLAARISGLQGQGEGIPRYEGYLVVGDELRPLPIGSTLDAGRGILSWQPGPGFLGDYRLVFVDRKDRSRSSLTIRIKPRYSTSKR
jgi:hypothetical protein